MKDLDINMDENEINQLIDKTKKDEEKKKGEEKKKKEKKK